MRSTCTVFLLCLCFLAASPSARAQQSAAVVTQRDPAALALLTQATTALRGATVLAQFSSAQTVGSIQAAPGTTAKAGTFTWLHQFSTSGFQFRSAFTSNGQTQIFASGTSGTAVSVNGKVRNMSSHVSAALPPLHLPAVVLNMFLANPNYSLTVGSPAQLGGHESCFCEFEY